MRPRVLRLFTPLPPRVFFFSSRRRHTRYIGDWSSDVCSSDLLQPTALQEALVEGEHEPGRRPEERCEEEGHQAVVDHVRELADPADLPRRESIQGDESDHSEESRELRLVVPRQAGDETQTKHLPR